MGGPVRPAYGFIKANRMLSHPATLLEAGKVICPFGQNLSVSSKVTSLASC